MKKLLLLGVCLPALAFAQDKPYINTTTNGGTPGGAAGGDLSGTYPNPTVTNSHIAGGTISGITSLGVSGTAPTITGTGTPSAASGSTNIAGEVTAGTAATSVVITFAGAPLAVAPFCVVSWQANLLVMAYTISASAITITQTATTGDKIDYHCFLHS